MTIAPTSPRVDSGHAAAAASAPTRPLIAIIANVQTPYRAYVHRRLVREMPGIRIASLFTHHQPDQAWESGLDPEINPVEFGRGEPVSEQASPARWWRNWRKGGRITRWLKENNAAAVLVGGYNDPGRVRVIAWCARAGIPCFLYADSNIHGDRARGRKRAIKKALVGWVVGKCAGVMPCGTLGAEYFRRYGVRDDRIFFFPYEPDYEAIRSVPRQAVNETCAGLGLDRSRRRLVVCARLLDWKRVDLAIRAFAAASGARPEWDLIIIGDGPERAALEAMAPAELRHRVRFLGFIGESETIAAIEHASDVLVCPSDTEPWGVVINEAVAAGMAVIATDTVGAAAELVREGVNGGVVPAGDLDALTKALLRVTDRSACDRLKAGSPEVLADWRRRGDPVAGLRAAATSAGILTATGAPTPGSAASR